MTIELKNLGKKYYKQWIFRNLDLVIGDQDCLAITGPNGSGKSTLLNIIGGYTLPSEGTVDIASDQHHHDPQLLISFAAPYLNLIEEFSLMESLEFHAKFKSPLISLEEMCHLSGLKGNEHKLVQEFSSGMKQRLRLSLAFFYQSSAIFLDEPTSNLDANGIAWYNNLIEQHRKNRMTIVASNQPNEYQFCSKSLSMQALKSQFRG